MKVVVSSISPALSVCIRSRATHGWARKAADYPLGVLLGLLLWAAIPEAHGQAAEAIVDAIAEDGNCTVFVEPGTSDFDISAVANPAADVVFPDDAVLGEVVFTRYPIFDADDPEENNALFGFVDFLHIDTRPEVISSRLLFDAGDTLNTRILQESARVLRDSDYLYDARVWPYRVCGNRVDVEVLTREVWTLSGGASLSRSGGADETSVSIADSNFLGYGKTVSLESTSTTDRDGIEFGYQDPNVAGSRHTLDLFYADNDDGFHTSLDAERPFYSLDARLAWGIRYNNHEREEDVYERGEEVASYEANLQRSEIYLGRSGGWEGGETRRWWYGLHLREESYSTVEDEPAPEELPASREMNYPFVGFDLIEESFVQVSNLNQMHRIEDFNLGRSWGWRVGIADTGFGSDTDRLIYQANTRNAWKVDESTLMQLETSLQGMWGYSADQSEEVLFETNWRWYNGVGKQQGTYLALDLRVGHRLQVNQELLLGSEEQLRGYPARYQSGDRSFVFSAERRFYTDWHWWRLVRVGGAVFFDVGRAWESGDENAGATGILADAGFGFRFSSSRAQTKQILHVDFAFPFQRADDIDNVQVLITAKQSF